jgi:integrase
MYYADFYVDGRRVRQRLSHNLDTAREMLNELRCRADKASIGLLDNDYPLKLMKDSFLRHCEQTMKPSSLGRVRLSLNTILPNLGASRATQIRNENIEAYRAERLKAGLSPRTINLEVSTLSTMLRWAASPNVSLIAKNPLEGLKPLRHDHPKEGRALTDDEVKRLLEKSPQPYRDIWYAYLVTGMRKGELAYLLFSDIDWENRDLIVRTGRAKNHRERRIPIDAGLWEILCRQRDGREARRPGTGYGLAATAILQGRFTTAHVFVTSKNTPLNHRSHLYIRFLRCCEAAGIETRALDADGREIHHVDVHSLRRTFATNLVISGADPKSVQELLGHRTLDMTMRLYTKIHASTKRQTVGRLSYGQGTVAPDHLVQLPATGRFFEPFGPQMVTSQEKSEAV